MENDLNNVAADKKVVVFNHDSCPDENGFKVKHGVKTLDLRERGLIAWVYGHYHYNAVNDIDGILNITTTSPTGGGSDSSPSAIRTIEMTGNMISNTYLHYMYYDRGATDEGFNWQQQVSGRILFAEPIIVGDSVIISTLDDGYPRKPIVASISADTGKIEWENIANNSVRNSMAVSDSRVYAQDVEGFMHCYDLESGSKLWARDLNLEYPRNAGNGITFKDGIVYGGNSRKIVALNGESGEVKWENNNKKGESSPFKMTIHGDKLLVGANWDCLTAINIDTGKTAWKMKEKGFRNTASTPYYYDNKLIVASSSMLGEISLESGKLIRKTELKDYNFDSGSTPAFADGILYYSTTNIGVVAISRDTLEVQWNYKTRTSLVFTAPYTNGDKCTVESSIVIKEQHIIFGASDGYIYSIDRKSGKLVSEFNIGSPIFTAVAVYGENIIVADFSGKVTSLQYKDGLIGL